MEGCPISLSPGLDSHGGDDERPPLRYVHRRATVVAVPDVQAHGGDCRPDEDRVDDVIREESLMSDAITVYGMDFGSHVVAHLPEVGGASLHHCSGLGGEQLAQGRLGSLDAAGQNGLLADKGTHQEVGIGQAPSLAGKPADSPVGGRKVDGEFLVPCQRRREGALTGVCKNEI
jgi:hypothetical protein